MFNRFLQHTRKPQGFWGRMMLRGMNAGHARLAAWGMSHIHFKQGAHVLDVGCGGGANIATMLASIPDAVVDGLDYSEDSVVFSKKRNAQHLGTRCSIYLGEASRLPYPDHSLDYVTAFETVYFWFDLVASFSEILRVLKPGGALLICCESDDADDTTWTERIQGMRVYRAEELKALLERLGFRDVVIHRHPRSWICLMAQR